MSADTPDAPDGRDAGAPTDSARTADDGGRVAVAEVYAMADPEPESGVHLLFARAADDRIYHVGRFDADDLGDAEGLAVPDRETGETTDSDSGSAGAEGADGGGR